MHWVLVIKNFVVINQKGAVEVLLILQLPLENENCMIVENVCVYQL